MVQIEFYCNQMKIVIQGNYQDKFQDVINKFLAKAQLKNESITYMANGKPIEPENTVESQMSQINKDDKMIGILVNLTNSEEEKEKIEKSKNIICPQCQEPCKYQIENYKITLYDCINNHVTKNIKIVDFPNTQEINISNIICDICKVRNKGNTFNNEMHKCLTCLKNLCPLCISNHDLHHYIIDYYQKNYICEKHKVFYTKYCQNCKLNLCIACEKEHSDHSIIYFGDIMPNMDKLKAKLSDLKQVINRFNEKIKKIIEKLEYLAKTIDIYYELQNNILNNYDKRKDKNYHILQNISNICNDDDIYEHLNEINISEDFKSNIFEIFDLSNKINLDYEDKKYDEFEYENLTNEYSDRNIIATKRKNYSKDTKSIEKDEQDMTKDNEVKNIVKKDMMDKMTIIYNIENNLTKIKLFGDNFVNQNKNNCYLIIDGKQRELCSELNLNNIQKENNILEIKLIESKIITNMNGMFSECLSLKSLSEFSKWNTINVTDMSGMFNGCKSLKDLPDFSNWDISNVTNLCYIFKGCESLKTLPDISNWNMKNVNNMQGMFKECSSLEYLPDISKWNTENVTNMSYLFNECKLLESLPNISNWNITNVNNLSGMFEGCVSLKSLPDISRWDLKNVKNISRLFKECKLLKTLPDISNWNCSNVLNMNGLFYDCESLESLPEITKWEIKNDSTMIDMFNGCKSLNSIPDIYRWRFSKLKEKTIIYNSENIEKNIKIFGEIFVKNNAKNCQLIIDGIKQDLCSDFKLKRINKESILEIKLIEI